MSSQPLLQSGPGTLLSKFPAVAASASARSHVTFSLYTDLLAHVILITTLKALIPNLTTPPSGKRIALPTRVEPKVFFANERTFLSWLNFTVILGGLALGLLNFGDRIGRISASLFTFVAMAAMIYALVTFHWRAKSIRQRGQGGFDDRFGPSVLAIALLAAVIVNFVLRIQEGAKGKA
ncbi:vacuolar transporter chaperone 1 [Blastomyces percursus]|uniref:Vacuolar transporter chaperone 1 n=1 Tax=Blastomyces percursus TaxID=1658174 RepID=A0A1J9Q4G5_9EURO|nr:vacuolar transporter chaperone 1 [Blastomyces percursus]